ncbi:hypothetical protein GCM10023213_17360 [Prosthecobacter algae]|uniref:Uncharacterized protein n=1 Tax=Prosthecobacter algae TaxID=1144682 RepID=A0ABP9P0N3_9BACT
MPLSPAAERRPYLSRAFQGAVVARTPLSLIASQRDARTAAIKPIHHAKPYYTGSQITASMGYPSGSKTKAAK